MKLISSKDGIIEAKPPSKEKKPSPRKAIRIRRVRQTKAKAKRRDNKAVSPGPQVKCRFPLLSSVKLLNDDEIQHEKPKRDLFDLI
jgi:hypothetical protein